MVRAADVSLRFRDGVLDDAEAIAALARQTFTDFFGQEYRKEDLDDYLQRYFSIDRVQADLADPEIDYRIAVAGSNMVGYAKIGPANLPGKPQNGHALQLHRLYVRETRQGVGMGGILLSWAIGRAKERGAEELCLGVWNQNKSAISMYESRGFEPQGCYDIQIGRSHDQELIMSLKLKDNMVA